MLARGRVWEVSARVFTKARRWSGIPRQSDARRWSIRRSLAGCSMVRRVITSRAVSTQNLSMADESFVPSSGSAISLRIAAMRCMTASCNRCSVGLQTASTARYLRTRRLQSGASGSVSMADARRCCASSKTLWPCMGHPLLVSRCDSFPRKRAASSWTRASRTSALCASPFSIACATLRHRCQMPNLSADKAYSSQSVPLFQIS